jgi:hypothetical protein
VEGSIWAALDWARHGTVVTHHNKSIIIHGTSYKSLRYVTLQLAYISLPYYNPASGFASNTTFGLTILAIPTGFDNFNKNLADIGLPFC